LVQFIYYLSPAVINAPLFVLWIIGIIVALTTRRKHPQVSLLAAAGLAIQLFETAAALIVRPWIVGQAAASGWSTEKTNVLWMASTFVQVFLSTIAWLLILLAIFKYRHQPNRTLGHDGQYLPEGFVEATIEPIQPGDHNVCRRPNP
jgi:hypothetical protein